MDLLNKIKIWINYICEREHEIETIGVMFGRAQEHNAGKRFGGKIILMLLFDNQKKI